MKHEEVYGWDVCAGGLHGKDCGCGNAKEQPDAIQVGLAIDFLSKYVPLKRFNKKCGSYMLKHVAEREMDCYISNGALIEAALWLDYPVVFQSPGDINAYIGFSSKIVNNLYKKHNSLEFYEMRRRQRANKGVQS